MLNRNHLSDWTHNKAISKIVESARVSDANKNRAKQLMPQEFTFVKRVSKMSPIFVSTLSV
jgi:hypothetical protein